MMAKNPYQALTDPEPSLLNILLEWLGEIGYTTVTRHPTAAIELFWNGADTEARLDIDDDEVILYTRKNHPSLRAGIYDEKAFGRLKRFLEIYAESFEHGTECGTGVTSIFFKI